MIEEGKKRFVNEVTALSQAFAITIRQVIDQALVSGQVIDVFDAARLKKPDISVLSEEFLAELQGMARKNMALEFLKKLLNDKIKARENLSG